MDTISKTIALLWALWLVLGSRQAMQTFLGCVRGLVTDGGVESHIVDAPDTLRDFLAWISGAPRPNLDEGGAQQFLFKNAVQSQGWKIVWDGLLRRTLASTRFFPAWLELSLLS